MEYYLDIESLKKQAKLVKRYEKQLFRLHNDNRATGAIEQTVEGTIKNLKNSQTSSLVIYGDPQSGKTEMMIALTARLFDEGYPVIIHLMNDSVDLLTQNLKRFKHSGIAPTPRTYSELPQDPNKLPAELLIFCKKNTHDLQKIITLIANKDINSIVIIDDEADYATPNGKINQGLVTKINGLVAEILGDNGFYIGVTATPARLNLNKTFDNKTETWVQFPSHDYYTGQDTFFPLDMRNLSYRLHLIGSDDPKEEARDAIIRFLVTASYLNSFKNGVEQYWTMLIHTSGHKSDHKIDLENLENFVSALLAPESDEFVLLMSLIFSNSLKLYPDADPNIIAQYILENASRITWVILNSERERNGPSDSASDPTSPFTIIIGGNIVSRGVTFQNLLSMYFTRDVKTKLQQDTYIQRARMFGARGAYLQHFELTIPPMLYSDWRRCFIFHRLALQTINNQLGAPVWLGDSRISVASNASIDKTTVQLDKGEMSFPLFLLSDEADIIIEQGPTEPQTLKKLQNLLGKEVLPSYLIEYIQTMCKAEPPQKAILAIHKSSTIDGYKEQEGINKENITRKKGFMGKTQLEKEKFPDAKHHIKIFYNKSKKARVFYKYTEGIQFIQNFEY
ncbi:Z1 domain-containing protein [Cronobacter turicensis]|uniref:Z1 domain-containing protein n=1 Tax=unclassified Cronobacter TaxID=2649764 RepID=UPI0013EA0A0F|nr:MULTISPECIES: Z1 domain-containing protein [unclassified Cronobacter]ELQ6227240.1 DEAD/DEAH box helicase family protein [Cronobacter turicensis]KAF6598041.1 DEAD/DEAH box helicase family protein [Cronobacter sp. EKM101R]KAF6598767.1 DEAD/DEAH box helicase family protein [Cronobacter sp. EKM102R]